MSQKYNLVAVLLCGLFLHHVACLTGEKTPGCEMNTVLPDDVILRSATVQAFIEESEASTMTVLYLHSSKSTLCKQYLEEIKSFIDLLRSQGPQGVSVGAIDVDENPEIAESLALQNAPVLMFAGQSKNLQEYNGIFGAEEILAEIKNALEPAVETISTVDQWDKITKEHYSLVLGLVNDMTSDDKEFFNNFNSLFEGSYHVAVIADQTVRNHLKSQGLLNDTIDTTYYICSWQRFADIPSHGVECTEFVRLDNNADFEMVFTEFARYATFINKHAYGPYDFYSQVRRIQMMERETPLLYVVSSFVNEREGKSESLFNRVVRLIAHNKNYHKKIYTSYVEYEMYKNERDFKGLTLETPTLVIQDSLQLPYLYKGVNPSDKQITAFVEDFLAGKIEPYYISEAPEAYQANNSELHFARHLVGSNVQDFLERSQKEGSGVAFILTHWDPTNNSAEAISSFLQVAEETRLPHTFGLLNTETNLPPSKVMTKEIRQRYHEDLVYYFRKGDLESPEVFEGKVTDEGFKTWLEKRIQNIEVNAEL